MNDKDQNELAEQEMTSDEENEVIEANAKAIATNMVAATLFVVGVIIVAKKVHELAITKVVEYVNAENADDVVDAEVL